VAHPVLTTFAIALVVRVGIVVLFGNYFSGRFVFDDTTYHLMSSQMAAYEVHFWDAYTRLLYEITAGLTFPLTYLYRIFGPQMVVGQLWVTVVGAAAAAVTARIAMEFMARKHALLVGLILAFLPSQVMWSSVIMKDASVWLALASIGAAVAVAARSRGLQLLGLGVVIGAALYFLGHLRQHTLVVACIALVIASFAGRKDLMPARVLGALLLAVGIPLLVGIGPAGYDLVANAGSLEERRLGMAAQANTAFVAANPLPTPPEAVELYDQQAEIDSLLVAEQARLAALLAKGAEAGTGAAADAARKIAQLEERKAEVATQIASLPPAPVGEESGNPDLAHLPKGLEVMLFEPTPWYPGGSAPLKLARAETLIWYPLLVLASIGLVTSLRRYLRSMLFPVVVGGGILILYALTEGNIGTAYRHRGEFVWVVALLAGLGIRHLLTRRNERSEVAGATSS
jgi:hypothetical protein